MPEPDRRQRSRDIERRAQGPEGPPRLSSRPGGPAKRSSATGCGAGRFLRVFATFAAFVGASLRRLREGPRLPSLRRSFATARDDAARPAGAVAPRAPPLAQREWDRMLFGVFTYDGPYEYALRQAARETHLSRESRAPLSRASVSRRGAF